MNSIETTSATHQASRQSSHGVSIAIVIAGALIAAAIYYSGGAATSTGPGAAVAGVEAPEPAAPEIGDIRAVSADDHIRGPDSAK